MLENSILDTYDDAVALPELKTAVRRFDEVLATFDSSLSDLLDAALNSEGAVRDQRHREAALLVDRYLDRLASDGLVSSIDSNPFRPTSVRSTLGQCLRLLSSRLA